MEKMNKLALPIIVTSKTKIHDLGIKNGQLIFVEDHKTIAFDFNNKRTFYNQIITLNTDDERQSILAPINGAFYFVFSTAVLWTYKDGWIQITTHPSEIVYIGSHLPELGSANTLYVDKKDTSISVWDDELNKYVVVADKTEAITTDEILILFEEKN